MPPVLTFECSDEKLTRVWRDKKTSGTVDPDLATDVDVALGVYEGEPGYTQVEIAPQGTSRFTWARGLLAIPQGEVSVSWSRSEHDFTVDVTAPVGVHIRPFLSASPTDQILIDGEPVPPDSVVLRSASMVELCVLPGATYRFTVRRA